MSVSPSYRQRGRTAPLFAVAWATWAGLALLPAIVSAAPPASGTTSSTSGPASSTSGTASPANGTASPADADVLDMPLERLLDVKVFTASKFEQRMSEAPSAVTVITAQDIKTYGYRTLADILRSIRSVEITFDHNYNYFGARGFSIPGDYNSRVLLLIDGHPVNDGVYGQAPIDREFPLDVDLIDRVEFVPGPGSALFGSNAVFGVINVFTKSGEQIGGAQVAAGGGSYDGVQGRATYGTRYDNGARLLMSATGFNYNGEDVVFPEYDSPSTNGGRAQGLDFESAQNAFVKLDYEGLQLEAGTSRRKKGIPTASFGQVFDESGANTVDSYAFVAGHYSHAVGENLELSGNLDYWEYDYFGQYMYDPTGAVVNEDGATSRWWSGGLQLLDTAIDRHKLIVGGDYRHDYQANQTNYDQPGVVYLDSRQTAERTGLFVQDEFTVTEHLILNAGIRGDHYGSQNVVSPRIGVVLPVRPTTTVKLLYGSAYRIPNEYEKYYVTNSSSQEANPNLRPERIQTWDLDLEHYIRSNWRVTAAVFYYRIHDLIDLATDTSNGLLQYQNTGDSRARGAELETEYRWNGGARLRASATWQIARDNAGNVRTDSPKYMAKLNYSVPVVTDATRLGVESQLMSERSTVTGGSVAGFGVTNVTLSSSALAKNLETSFSVYNLFDRHYDDPPGIEHFDSLGRQLQGIPQYGRTFWVKFQYTL
jgi:outer membrane receptor protein involved in Fe transport